MRVLTLHVTHRAIAGAMATFGLLAAVALSAAVAQANHSIGSAGPASAISISPGDTQWSGISPADTQWSGIRPNDTQWS